MCVCVSSLPIVFQETQMIACDCEVRADCLTSSTNITTGQRGVNVLGPLRDVRAACKHLEGGVLFQALKAAGERCQN